MFTIRKEQLQVLGNQMLSELARTLALQLKGKLGHTLGGDETHWHENVAAWVRDAWTWGLRSNASISKYVEDCVRMQGGRRADLATRLGTYLRLYHSEQSARSNVQKVVEEAMMLAEYTGIHAEEGVAWLAAILLYAPPNADRDWLKITLRVPGIDEEQRLKNVHIEAIRRGWTQLEKGS